MSHTVAICALFVPLLGIYQCKPVDELYFLIQPIYPRGWIHRNRIVLNGKAHTFTVPVCLLGIHLSRCNGVQISLYVQMLQTINKHTKCPLHRCCATVDRRTLCSTESSVRLIEIHFIELYKYFT